MPGADKWVTEAEREQHRQERADNGYSVYDWWSFDIYIAGVIASAAERFRDNGVGFPCGYDEDPEEADAAWKATLTKISSGLRGWENHFNTDQDPNIVYREAKEAFHLFAEHFGSFWD